MFARGIFLAKVFYHDLLLVLSVVDRLRKALCDNAVDGSALVFWGVRVV